jgi:hypothetical protein
LETCCGYEYGEECLYLYAIEFSRVIKDAPDAAKEVALLLVRFVYRQAN